MAPTTSNDSASVIIQNVAFVGEEERLNKSPASNEFSDLRKRKYSVRSADLVSPTKPKYIEIGSANEFSDDDDDQQISGEITSKSHSPTQSVDEGRRAHHNLLERRRRDHIKDHFTTLKNAIPLLEGEKSSRALILKRAVDYIKMLQQQISECKLEIREIKQNADLTAKQQTTTAAIVAAAFTKNACHSNSNAVMGNLLANKSAPIPPSQLMQSAPLHQFPIGTAVPKNPYNSPMNPNVTSCNYNMPTQPIIINPKYPHLTNQASTSFSLSKLIHFLLIFQIHPY